MCFRTGPRGQPIGPPESQHPLPEQVADRRSVFVLSPSPSLVFFHRLIEFFSTRSSAWEKEKQLLESRKCSSEALCLKCVGSLQSCAFFKAIYVFSRRCPRGSWLKSTAPARRYSSTTARSASPTSRARSSGRRLFLRLLNIFTGAVLRILLCWFRKANICGAFSLAWLLEVEPCHADLLFCFSCSSTQGGFFLLFKVVCSQLLRESRLLISLLHYQRS